MRFTARARLQTWAHASRMQSDEDTYDLERTVVGSVVAGVTADVVGSVALAIGLWLLWNMLRGIGGWK